MKTRMISSICGKAIDGEDLSREEIGTLLRVDDPEAKKVLFRAADEVRRIFAGDEIQLRGIVEFSSHCSNNCLYCGLRRDNRSIPRYRLDDDVVVRLAENIEEKGCRTIVLQSGEGYAAGPLGELVRRIKKSTSLAVTLSTGEMKKEEYRHLRDCGASRFLIRHETASPELYARLHPGRSLESRLACTRWLKELGFEIGMGCMVGLPGQSVDDLADDIELMKTCDADMIGIGPFIPHPGTPLAGERAGDASMVLKMLAVTRLATRNTNIPATTALGALDADARRMALGCGCNVIMPVFTPAETSEFYDIYPGKAGCHEALGEIGRLERFIEETGRTVGKTPGGRCDLPGWREGSNG